MKNIAVIFGGSSSEYKVSLSSAASVFMNIDKEKYNVIPIGITAEGRWFRYYGAYENIENDTWNEKNLVREAFISPDTKVHGIGEIVNDKVKFTYIDEIFPVLHGINGEDGTIQGLAQLAGIKIVGCGVLASALCMDKYKAHQIAEAAGIKVPSAVLIDGVSEYKNKLEEISNLRLPLYVKPVRGGSSIGISRVVDESQLKDGIFLAFQYDTQVLIEEEIEGFEVGCAIMGSSDLIIGAVDEIEIENPFFDYHEKYTQLKSKLHLPARLPIEKRRKIQEVAAIIYKALGCSGLARVDLFVNKEGEIYFNEVNTMPGLTSHSRFPKMIEAEGIDYVEMLTLAIEL